MTALTIEADRPFSGGQKRRLPSEISANPFNGSAMSYESDGFIHELVAGEPFAGFCVSTIQTKDAASADGSRYVDVLSGIFVAILTVSGAAADDAAHTRNVYASDDNTFTFTAAGNSLIGQVIGYEASGKAIVLCRTAGEVPMGALNGKTFSFSTTVTLTTEHLGATIFGDTQAGAFTVTLPAAADCTGRCYTFVRAGSGTNALTLDGDASENIDGATTLATMDAARDTVTIQSDGSNWFIVASRVA